MFDLGEVPPFLDVGFREPPRRARFSGESGKTAARRQHTRAAPTHEPAVLDVDFHRRDPPSTTLMGSCGKRDSPLREPSRTVDVMRPRARSRRSAAGALGRRGQRRAQATSRRRACCSAICHLHVGRAAGRGRPPDYGPGKAGRRGFRELFARRTGGPHQAASGRNAAGGPWNPARLVEGPGWAALQDRRQPTPRRTRAGVPIAVRRSPGAGSTLPPRTAAAPSRAAGASDSSAPSPAR